MKALVIAEFDNKEVKAATLATVAAATEIATSVDVLVVGYQNASVGEAYKAYKGISKILLVDDAAYEYPLAESLAQLVHSVAQDYELVMAPATTYGKNLLPRVAAKSDMAMLSDVIAIDGPSTFVRPIYAGNAIATVELLEPKKFLTIRPTSFEAVAQADNSAEIVNLPAAGASDVSSFVGVDHPQSERPELTAARVVISGGRALKSAENFQLIEALADKLNAAIGASRAAVDAGFVPNDYQVGQTGKVVAPELYIAIGISGAIQHLAGMKDSKVIVAINKDPDAPIFEVADYGLVGDLFEILPEFTAAL